MPKESVPLAGLFGGSQIRQAGDLVKITDENPSGANAVTGNTIQNRIVTR